jgi:hypothetical protein
MKVIQAGTASSSSSTVSPSSSLAQRATSAAVNPDCWSTVAPCADAPKRLTETMHDAERAARREVYGSGQRRALSVFVDGTVKHASSEGKMDVSLDEAAGRRPFNEELPQHVLYRDGSMREW